MSDLGLPVSEKIKIRSEDRSEAICSVKVKIASMARN